MHYISTQLSQFKVLDPSNVAGYGNSTNVEDFKKLYPTITLRIPTKK